MFFNELNNFNSRFSYPLERIDFSFVYDIPYYQEKEAQYLQNTPFYAEDLCENILIGTEQYEIDMICEQEDINYVIDGADEKNTNKLLLGIKTIRYEKTIIECGDYCSYNIPIEKLATGKNKSGKNSPEQNSEKKNKDDKKSNDEKNNDNNNNDEKNKDETNNNDKKNNQDKKNNDDKNNNDEKNKDKDKKNKDKKKKDKKSKDKKNKAETKCDETNNEKKNKDKD
ncbi:hypothetical protein HZS_2162, partial [Henneguya salminicola]